MDINNFIFIGIVTSYGETPATVRVSRPDRDNVVSGELTVTTTGTSSDKVFWMPKIGDEVLCVCLPNVSGKGASEGYVIACIPNTVDKTDETNNNARSLKMSDGSYIRFDDGNIELHAAKDMTITSDGNIKLTATRIDLNDGG